MANAASEVRVFGDGGIYVAQVGTDFPDTVSDPIDTGDWAQLGYLSTAGPRFSIGRDTKDIEVWQSLDPVRTVATKVPKQVKADLMQHNAATVETALGGGDIIEVAPGEYEYQPPDASDVDEKAMIVVMLDGDLSYRYCFRRATLDSATDFAGVHDDATRFAVSWKILQPDGGDKPFLIQTDDPAFAPTALFS